METAESTYSFSFSAKTLLRTSRAVLPQLKRLTTRMSVQTPEIFPIKIGLYLTLQRKQLVESLIQSL